VGLKRIRCWVAGRIFVSSNRTIVGLKLSFGFGKNGVNGQQSHHCGIETFEQSSAQERHQSSNRTIVGLKQRLRSKFEGGEEAAIAPLWD